MVYEIIVLLLTASYILFFLLYLFGWIMLPVFRQAEFAPQTKVSIIVPARNEEKSISRLLNCLLTQSYPDSLYEIIIVDDFSEDNTLQVIKSFDSFKIKLLQLKDFISNEERIMSFKKKAIEVAVTNSTGELIVTTDADCRMNENWLKTLVNFYEIQKCRMIVAPVLINEEKGFFAKFQSLDLIGLMGITGATLQIKFPTMCNGANLAFGRKSFYEVNGYADISEKSSGDDMLLMHKMGKKWPGAVKFIRNTNAIVYTSPQKTLSSFIAQRMRWTSKSQAYSDWKIKMNLLLIYLFNLSLPVACFLSILMGKLWLMFFFQLAVKLILDFVFLSQVTEFFNRRRLLWLFLPVEAAHIIYIVVVGFAGNFFQSTWKGRKVK